MQDYIKLVLARFNNAKFSTLFVNQLVDILEHRGEVSEIIQEIEALENLGISSSYTKPPKEFSGHILKGFWHKHYFFGEFMAQNLLNALASPNKKTKKLKMKKKVGEIINSQKSEQEKSRELARLMTEGLYEQKASEQKLTGEWIIYKNYEGKNYYLTLAKHNEKDELIEGDEVIYQRIIKGCQAEFPFLFGSELM